MSAAPGGQNKRCFDSMVLCMVLFVLSGIASPMLLMEVRFNYDPPKASLWPLYPLYLGNLLAGVAAPPSSQQHVYDATRLFGFDAAGQLFSNLGLLMIGPPLFAIFYKSVTVFTGLLTLCFLPPSSHPTRIQWLAMLIVTSGLLVQGWDAVSVGASELVGGLLVIVGCLFWAGGAVASEMILGLGQRSMHPLQAAWILGVEGTVACAAWAVFNARGEFLGAPGFWVLFAAMIVSNACHQATWFTLVSNIGACATAVLKAFQSVCLFLSAGALFCGKDAQECLTREMVASFVIVSIGVLLYSYPTQRTSECSQPLVAGDSQAACCGTFDSQPAQQLGQSAVSRTSGEFAA